MRMLDGQVSVIPGAAQGMGEAHARLSVAEGRKVLHRDAMMAAATDAEGGGIAAQDPLRRMAEPEEAAKVVLFLVSDDSSYASGMEHVIDDGLTAQ